MENKEGVKLVPGVICGEGQILDSAPQRSLDIVKEEKDGMKTDESMKSSENQDAGAG